MPFCTSCGAEVAADKKFCVQCGAPMEQVTAPAAPVTPAAIKVPVTLPPDYGTPPVQPKKPNTSMIIGGIVVVLVIIAVVYFAGMPMLKANQKSSDGFVPSQTPAVTHTMVQTALPTLQYTTTIPETTTLPVEVRDARLEEDYEQVYTLNQKFAFGQKVNFAHDLTRPPLYIKFNLTPTIITRHRLISIGTNNEHYENTTETSPYAWFEVKVLDAGSGSVIDQQGFGNDYSDITKQNFMVRQKGNYRIEMSGNEVLADVQVLIGTP
ncbi:MAG: zinc ribbon domain-containing protein [Methanoregula sp.]|nr:zinc ribbon domain-containing protein [Methanoregula sp.]